jgi:hypothetical protein
MKSPLTVNLSSAAYNTTGFVALDNVNKLIVVSFRGTDNRSIATSLTNVESKLSAQKPIPLYCANCSGAKGYVQAFSEVNTTVIATIQGLRITNSDYQVVATGHSLGGAVAAFATLELRRLGIPVHFVRIRMKPSAVQAPMSCMANRSIAIGFLRHATNLQSSTRRLSYFSGPYHYHKSNTQKPQAAKFPRHPRG